MLFLFWFSLAIAAYVYVGYPGLMALLSRRMRHVPPPPLGAWPSVTLIIAAYNEECVIAEKLRNSLALDYPRERLDILVVSDGSTDDTETIAADFATRGVRCLRLPGRQGKTAAQNAAVRAARGEVLLFSDANALYAPDAVKQLVRHFALPDVGCVEGRRADIAARGSATARHELAFRDFESRLKTWESRVSSCVGATGPIYAVRRRLYIPLDPAMISDLMEPLLIRTRHGKRQVFEPNAISREIILTEMTQEFRRKVRIITRCLNSLRMAPEVLSPWRAGGVAWQVISHRLLRWLFPLFAVGALTANLFLLHDPLYQYALLAQLAFLAAAIIGWALDRYPLGPSWARLPYTFAAANVAALIALGHCLVGHNIRTWQTQRAQEAHARMAHTMP